MDRRLGANPLEWIKDTRKGREDKSKQSKPSLPGKQVKPKDGTAPTKTVKAGLREGWTRATLILRDEHLEKVKALAYWDRREIKEVVDEALGAYLKGKTIKPIQRKGA